MPIMSNLNQRYLHKNSNLPTLQSNPSGVVGFAILYSNKEKEGWRVHISKIQVIIMLEI